MQLDLELNLMKDVLLKTKGEHLVSDDDLTPLFHQHIPLNTQHLLIAPTVSSKYKTNHSTQNLGNYNKSILQPKVREIESLLGRKSGINNHNFKYNRNMEYKSTNAGNITQNFDEIMKQFMN